MAGGLVVLVPLALAVGAQPAPAQIPAHPWMNTSLTPEQRTELLLDAMRINEKLQQLYNLPVHNEDLDEGTAPDDGGPCDFAPVGRHVEGIPDLAIPDFRFANGGTGIRGGDCLPEPTATGLPSQVASAATFNPPLMHEWGQVLDNEIYGWAHQALWGPGMNLIRTPWGGRNHEYFSEDPFLTGAMSSGIVRGIQASGRTHATIKHFAANEQEYQFERWTAASRVPSRAMHEMYLLPFEMAVRDAKPAAVMCAYPHLNFDYACESRALLTQTLRERWGFDGYILSDRRAMHSALPSILAGTQFELDETPQYWTIPAMRALLASGQITEATIDGMLRQRYIKMFAFGHFDNPRTEFQFDQVNYEANSELSRRAAEDSITLLKNENRTLPLRAGEVEDVALIGASWFAGEATLPPRSGDPTELTTVITPDELTVSPEEGLENTLEAAGNPSADVTYNDGDVIADAVELAEESDTVILMVGDAPRETRDVTSLSLPSVTGTNQEMLIPAILEANPNTVVVLKTQGMILMPWLDDALAVVEAWYPGQQDGNAVANVLFGVTNPSGKLPVTFGNTTHEAAYSSTAQYPGLREDNDLPGGPGREGTLGIDQLVTHYTEDLELGYRWYEANNVPSVFPFGHGLSYTTFDYSDLAVTAQSAGGRTVATVSYTITNTGQRRGKETSQVYLTLPRAADEPPKRLVGFQKVDLARGESRRVTVTVDSAASNHPLSYFVPADPQNLMRWADGEWATAGGTYTVQVGRSSARTPLRGTFEIAGAASAAGGSAQATAGNGTSSARAAKAAIRSRRVGASLSRVVKVRVRCPVSIGPRGCRGVLTATSGKAGARERVGRNRFSIAAGRVTTVRLKLSRSAYRRLTRQGSMSVRLELRIRRAGGDVQRTARRVRVVATATA